MSKELTHRADELKDLGWSAEDVARYAELWDYRQRWGAINLERDDRLFLKTAESALPKISSGKASVKKNIKDKSYYRRLVFYLASMDDAEKTFDLSKGSRGVWAILLEEELAILDHYEPVLGLPDTIKSKEISPYREIIIERALSLPEESFQEYQFDFEAPLTALKTKEDCKWHPLIEDQTSKSRHYPVLTPSAVKTFRRDIRRELSILIKETFPSLSESVKPDLPDD